MKTYNLAIESSDCIDVVPSQKWLVFIDNEGDLARVPEDDVICIGHGLPPEEYNYSDMGFWEGIEEDNWVAIKDTESLSGYSVRYMKDFFIIETLKPAL